MYRNQMQKTHFQVIRIAVSLLSQENLYLRYTPQDIPTLCTYIKVWGSSLGHYL